MAEAMSLDGFRRRIDDWPAATATSETIGADPGTARAAIASFRP
jgi:hypothetical protein